MNTVVEALLLVIGFPQDADVARAAGGSLRLAWRDGAVGIELATGAVTTPPEAIAPADTDVAKLRLSATQLDPDPQTAEWLRAERRYWWSDGVSREIELSRWFKLLTGDDEHLLVCDDTGLHRLDRRADLRHSLVPPALTLDDPVTGGIGGMLRQRPFVFGDWVVIARSPTILIMRLDVLLHGLGADTITWRLRTTHPLRDANATGRFRFDGAEREVRDRLWPQFGWAQIAMPDGMVPFRTPIPDHVECERAVVSHHLFAKPKRRRRPAWMNAPTAVERLLGSLRARGRRTTAAPDPDPDPDPDWKSYADGLGIACPEALVELGALTAGDRLCAGTWELCTPKSAEEARCGLVELARTFPALQARSKMMPLFGADGDLLLLAADGHVYSFVHDGFDEAEANSVAGSFEELLDLLATGERFMDPPPTEWARRYLRTD